jgi:hypothetical protein
LARVIGPDPHVRQVIAAHVPGRHSSFIGSNSVHFASDRSVPPLAREVRSPNDRCPRKVFEVRNGSRVICRHPRVICGEQRERGAARPNSPVPARKSGS